MILEIKSPLGLAHLIPFSRGLEWFEVDWGGICPTGNLIPHNPL